MSSSAVRVMGREFRYERELVDVTRMARPNEHWALTDTAGHVHRWFEADGTTPMQAYRPDRTYVLPTLAVVQDSAWEDEDGEHTASHWECKLCGDTIWPGTCADSTRQFLAGIATYTIDGEVVSPDVYRAELEKDIVAAKTSGQSPPDSP